MAKVLWHVTMSLDGFIAGPRDSMDWMLGFGEENDEVDELIKRIGAVLSGRRTYDVGAVQERPEFRRPYGGAFSGPVFVLTHKPPHDPGVTFLSGDIRTAVQTAAEAAGDKYVVIFGADIARQSIEAGVGGGMMGPVGAGVLRAGGTAFFQTGGGALHPRLAPPNPKRHGGKIPLSGGGLRGPPG